MRQLDFEPPDRERFPLLELAYEALRIGGAAGCVLNAADEVAVEAFLDDKIGFCDLPRVVSDVMDNVGLRQANSPREVLDLDREVRRVAWDYVQRRPKMFTV